jgi:glycosyltransferase involved in cell wall biosynthesis
MLIFRKLRLTIVFMGCTRSCVTIKLRSLQSDVSMKILFMHPNIPGQYKHLCRAFAEDPNNQVVFLCKPNTKITIPGVTKVEYELFRQPSPYTHRYLVGTERAVLQGQETWRVCKNLKEKEGFIPDVICAHPGWGDAMFIKDIYPTAKLINFFEFYYRATGSDVGFEHPATEDDKARIRTKNIINLLSLEACDWGVSPTRWQFQQYPSDYHYKMSVIHDGIDTSIARPNPNAKISLPDGKILKFGDPVVTYISRNFEHYRGFHTFMGAVKLLQEARPDVHVLAVGADEVSYGRPAPQGTTYRKMVTEQLKPDMSRLHFIGTLPYNDMLKVMQVSAAHIYLTYPFVLSWSMMEAMACECLMIGSKTAPVEEVITDGENGLLTDFFSPHELANRVLYALDNQETLRPLRTKARQTIVEHYDLKKLLPKQMELITGLSHGVYPSPSHVQPLRVKSA